MEDKLVIISDSETDEPVLWLERSDGPDGHIVIGELEEGTLNGIIFGVEIIALLCHGIATMNGWWDEDEAPRTPQLFVANQVAELAEYFELCARGREKEIDPKTGQEAGHVELVDELIRLLDWTAGNGVPLHEVLRSKIDYNLTRGYRHGGKKL